MARFNEYLYAGLSFFFFSFPSSSFKISPLLTVKEDRILKFTQSTHFIADTVGYLKLSCCPYSRARIIAGVYFSQTAVIHFCQGCSCLPYYQGVRKGRLEESVIWNKTLIQRLLGTMELGRTSTPLRWPLLYCNTTTFFWPNKGPSILLFENPVNPTTPLLRPTTIFWSHQSLFSL